MYTRYLKIKGDSFSRGKQIGEQLKAQILTNHENQLSHYKAYENGYDFNLWADVCMKYIPYMEKYTPEAFAEMQGMAEGSGLSLGKIIALNTAYEKSLGCEAVCDKCTSFSACGDATKDGFMICGQTNDERKEEWPYELDLTIHHLSDDGHEMMIYAHPGNVAYMGCNNKGLAILWTYIDNGLRRDAVPTNAIIREVLSMDNYDEAVEFVQKLPHSVPNYFKICHRDKGATGLECFPNRVYTKVYGNTSAHTNHNLFADDEDEKTGAYSTYQRQKNMSAMLEKNYGKIDASIAEDFFRDHTDFPYSICAHPNELRPMVKTLCAMVYDLGKGEMHICHSNPCENTYLIHRFDNYCVNQK